ncbi:hypothetical protein BVRB_2g030900 [Beta vulgaris subsp. vulgaris]|uniref:uncharacterized protein LOC104882940 n=1 Tax=Beta vulgaris subsp. vulgaris TaxID=3555 RepID=UPI0005402D13|nr:uncharacterized protein LOC104882940 [Beta vulgaris subsp. vulgaris]KMT18993.1 hypothetical protein BVRB_2g030900 [Beta vulgaris subsp. vulgaris]
MLSYSSSRSSSKLPSSSQLLPTLLYLYLLTLTVALATSTSLPPTPGGESEANYHHYGGEMGIFLSNKGRSLAEGPSYSSGENGEGNNINGGYGGYGGESSLLILAPRRTHRKDPIDGFKYYNGGWNISERHYWASAGFSAAPLFIISLTWFLVFGLCLLIISLCHFCCRREQRFGYSRVAYILSLVLLILFTLAAVIGCLVLYTGQAKFHRSTISTLEYLKSQADTTVWKLNNVSDYLSSAKQIGVQNIFLPSNVQTDIDEIDMKITASSSLLDHQSTDAADDIRDVLDSLRLALIIVAAIMLFLAFLGFVFSMFGMQVLVYTLVVFGWILVTGTFILCGVFLLFHNVAGDTCMAMRQWTENPTAHTALDEILPCVDPATSQETLKRSKEVTSQLVDLVNSVISNVSNINFGPQFRPFYYNQSGPLLPFVCNPFSQVDLLDRPCARGEVNLNNATQVLGNYVCQVDPNGICFTTGRLTPAMYGQIATAVNVSYGLYNYGPDLVALEDCSFVRETFTSIYSDHCPGLRRYSRWVYAGLVMVSFAVMFSLIFWVIYGRERKHRLYTKRRLSQGGHKKPSRMDYN